MIAYLEKLAWFSALFGFVTDAWFWNWAAMAVLATLEKRWRKEVQRQRDYWEKETQWWVDSCDRWVQLVGPMARAARLGGHFCHDAGCEFRKKRLHDCHKPECKLRKPEIN